MDRDDEAARHALFTTAQARVAELISDDELAEAAVRREAMYQRATLAL